MSNVFEAIHTETNSSVALKVLPRKLAQNAILLQRFLKEAKSAENLDHPHIVAIYDRGFDQGRHYLVLEYVAGKDLFDRVRANGPMGTSEAIAFVREVALGLEYAAQRGMIHRDIKPANLLITPDGHAKIIDLGLALMADEEDERVTRDGTTVGTVDYMSPEQARDSRKINERSDIYSLGCTLHYLVTGHPPFPGGNLADKLARHHSASIPDVRDRNPNVPASFAQLIRRMMAKKPEQRFANYSELLAALAKLDADPSPQDAGVLPDVLIDADDDDDEPIVLTVATPPSIPRPSLPGKPGVPDRRGPTPPERGVSEISLADLAGLDRDEDGAVPRGKINRALKPPADPSSAVMDAFLEDESEAEDPVAIGRRGGELPLQTWIVAGVGVGLLIAVVGFGVRFILSLTQDQRSAEPLANSAPLEAGKVDTNESNESGTYAASSPHAPNPSTRRNPFELVGPVPPANLAATRTPQHVAEVTFPDAILARLGITPKSAVRSIPATGTVVVRRLAEPTDSTQLTSLAAAFGRANDDLEIADVGPFHEDDFQLSGKQRMIRGKGGLRPIIKVEATRQTLVRDQDAKFLLGQNGVEQLTIEGIDLVVDVRDLPASQSTLFLCQGVDLTLRDCSVTIVNVEDRRSGFTIFRLATGPRPNRLLLERCLIRGPIQTLAQFAAGSGTITVDRSIVAGSNGPLIQIDPADRVDRSIQVVRSLLATRGPVIGWVGKPASTTLRVLGTTFAHVESPGPPVLWTSRVANATEARSWLDYDGEANRYIGWNSLAQWDLSPGSSASVVRGLQMFRPEADRQSRESGKSWPMVAVAETVNATTYAALVPDLDPVLQSVASPHPYSLEMTADLFGRLPNPGMLDDFSNEARGTTPPRPTTNLTFDTQSGRQVDFGLFLKEQVIDPSKRYVVRVQGTTNQLMSPVRLPDGSSLAIIGPGGTGTANPVPVFFAAAAGLALIEYHQGDLAIANIGFASDGTTRTRHWIWAEDSLLALRRCRYRDIGPFEESAGSAAIAFHALAPRAVVNGAGGFKAPPTRPTASLNDCWIWTSSDGVLAEVGRGSLDLDNCLLLAGPAAFRLKSVATRATELEADLILENCTIWNDRSGVVLEPAAEGSIGEGRPFLITSRSSVFPRSGREGGALLAVDPTTFAQGRLFWQSSNDLYEISRFLIPVGSTTSGPTPGADLKRNWIDLWGLNHTRNDRGPDPRRLDRVLHFRDKDRPRTGKVTPQQLELDPKLHSDQGVNFKSLPPFPKT